MVIQVMIVSSLWSGDDQIGSFTLLFSISSISPFQQLVILSWYIYFLESIPWTGRCFGSSAHRICSIVPIYTHVNEDKKKIAVGITMSLQRRKVPLQNHRSWTSNHILKLLLGSSLHSRRGMFKHQFCVESASVTPKKLLYSDWGLNTSTGSAYVEEHWWRPTSGAWLNQKRLHLSEVPP